ncbi:MAG TPA: hypothetical protein DEO85_12980 [Maritimibacter sp.]|nr:hypothetical protein [Maritimibacter sp.]
MARLRLRPASGAGAGAGRLSCSCQAYNAVAIAFLAHSVEELAGLPAWVASLPVSVAITQAQMSNAIIWLAILVIVVMIFARSTVVAWIQVAATVVAGALLANVVSHVALSAITWSYMPGTGTALLLVFPAAGYLITHAPVLPRTRWVAGLSGAVLMVPVTWAALWLAS